jgi:hypothetical protein
MDATHPKGLLGFLSQVPDPRSRHGRQHTLSAVLGLVCCAILCGARSYAAIAQWATDQDIAWMHRLGFNRTPPKMHGIRKILMALNVTAFEEALSRWAETLLGQPVPADDRPPDAFALDGKTVRGSFDGFHLLSVVAHASGLAVAQAEVPQGGEDKTNEHKAALRLLEGLVLKGRLLTGDAMFCHRDFCQQVLAVGGDYLVFVKDNQPTLLNDIQMAFSAAPHGAFSPSAAAALG